MGIVRDSNVWFDTTASVVVIGAGGAGATAALAARGAGADVLVLDRDAAPSGATASSSGMVPAAGTQSRKRAASTIRHSASPMTFRRSNGSADAPLVEVLTQARRKF